MELKTLDLLGKKIQENNSIEDELRRKDLALSEYENQDYLKERKMMKKMLDVSIAATSRGCNESMGFEPIDLQTGISRKP